MTKETTLRTGPRTRRMLSPVSECTIMTPPVLLWDVLCETSSVFFPDKMGSKRRSSDIISLLVSIYGSKDIFIDEYRAVLADRLLHQLNYNTAR